MSLKAVSHIKKIGHYIENSAILISLFFIILLPFIDMVGKRLGTVGLPDAQEYLRHLMIWFALLGAMISSRENNHISLAVFEKMLPERLHVWSQFFTRTVTGIVLVSLAFASIDHFWLISEGEKVAQVPLIAFTIAFPIGFGVMAIRAVTQEKIWMTVASLLISILFPLFVLGLPCMFVEQIMPDFMPSESFFQALFFPLLILLMIATALGAPVFIALAGVAGLLFFHADPSMWSLGNIPDEAYKVLKNEIFPTIPLFTMAGFILSESKSGERLVAFFRALFGWVPGGLAIMSVLVCAFFTTFTGASGVTILALGGLLHYIMTKEGYNDRFTEGYLTASGSIGLLFPPSLPIILYAVQAQINIKHLFAGGIVPGVFMIVALSVYAIVRGGKNGAKKAGTFDIKEVVRTFKGAALEVILPFLIVVLFFTGQATLIQTGVIAVLYMIVANLFVHRDFTILELPKIFLKAAPIAGSVLIILAAANGLSYYIIDAQIPEHLTDWVVTYLDPANPMSKIIFLLFLNLALLITGFFMDIFSAIIVVVPLILPISSAFGIGPVHLGVIFLANLELGYLTPPVGLNLFLAALRFEKPLVSIYRSVLPFLALLLVTVLVITYVPSVTHSGMQAFGYTSEENDTTHSIFQEERAEVILDTVLTEDSTTIINTVVTTSAKDSVRVEKRKVVDRQILKSEESVIIRDTIISVDTLIDTIPISSAVTIE